MAALNKPSLAQMLGGLGGFGAQVGAAAGPQGGSPGQMPGGATPAPGPGGQQGDPMMAAMGPQPAGSPQDAAIWQAFPSTDPSVVGQMMQQAQAQGVQGLLQMLPQLEQMQQADEDQLYQRQQATLHSLMGGMMMPPPDAMGAGGAGPIPGVGGNNTGY